MEYISISILAFILTTSTISKDHFTSTLSFLIEHLLSIVDIRAAFLQLIRMTIGVEKLSYVFSFIKPLGGRDFRFDVPAALSQLDLIVGITFLVSLGSLWYFKGCDDGWDDDFRFTKHTRRALDDFFGSPVLPSRQPNYAFHGLAPVTMADFFLQEAPAKSTNPLNDIFEYPVALTQIHKHEHASVVSVPPSWSVSAHTGLLSIMASPVYCAITLSSTISGWAAASKTRYLSLISSLTFKTATLSPLPILPTGCSLSDLSAANLDLTLLDDAEESDELEYEELRRVFGVVLPAGRWQPKKFTLADLARYEIDDGSYLRDALGISHSDVRECGYWPELDDYVPRRSEEQPGAWYTDAEEMRGWIFPGREDVPEFTFESIEASDWGVGDAMVLAAHAYATLR